MYTKIEAHNSRNLSMSQRCRMDLWWLVESVRLMRLIFFLHRFQSTNFSLYRFGTPLGCGTLFNVDQKSHTNDTCAMSPWATASPWHKRQTIWRERRKNKVTAMENRFSCCRRLCPAHCVDRTRNKSIFHRDNSVDINYLFVLVWLVS